MTESDERIKREDNKCSKKKKKKKKKAKKHAESEYYYDYAGEDPPGKTTKRKDKNRHRAQLSEDSALDDDEGIQMSIVRSGQPQQPQEYQDESKRYGPDGGVLAQQPLPESHLGVHKEAYNNNNNNNNNNRQVEERVALNQNHPRNNKGLTKSVVKFGGANNSSSILALDSLRSLDAEKEQALTEDIYSLLYISNMASQSFLFAFLVFFVQNGILWLILFDLLEFDNDFDNVIGLPPGVPVMVTIAQGLGVLLIVMTITASGDLTSGITRLVSGYNDDVLAHHAGAHRFKWFMAGSLQVIVGLLMLLDLFILMMQSETVVALCLNFAALHFVQEIDDISFLVGQKGFLSRSLQYECLEVSRLMVPKSKGRLKRRTRQGLTVALAIFMYIPFGILVNRQLTGRYVCRSLQVQFGDAFLPELAYFGGRFNIASTSNNIYAKINFRTIYYDDSKTIMLAYCSKEQAWTFAPTVLDSDPCNYFVKSSTTTTFDVLDVRDQTWFTWNLESAKSVPTDWLYLSCSDCGRDKDLCPLDIGLCVNNVCECLPNRMGRECEFGPPTCDDLIIDARTEPLPMEEGVIFPESYSILRHSVGNSTYTGAAVTVHQRPVYASDKETTGDLSWDFMLFAGRRWVIYAPKTERDFDTDIYTPELTERLSLKDDFYTNLLNTTHKGALEDLHSFLIDERDIIENYRPYFFSEPVDYDTETDVLEPKGLDWYRAERKVDGWWNLGYAADESYLIDAKFLCEKCDPLLNPCLNRGACNKDTRKCECQEYYVGSLCEQPVRCNPPTQPCLNQGNCSDWYSYCDCPKSFYGNLCQFQNVPMLLPASFP